MNESGTGLVETLLTIVIIMLIAGSLVPLQSTLRQTLHHQKLQLHASEVAYQGSLQVMRGQAYSGVMHVEGVRYVWQFEDDKICVTFHDVKGNRLKCV